MSDIKSTGQATRKFRWVPAVVIFAASVLGVTYLWLFGDLRSSIGYSIRPFTFALVALVILVLFRTVLDRITPWDDTATVVDDNNGPIALQRAAQYAALLLGMGGSLIMAPARPLLETLGSFALDGVIVAAALMASTFVTDWYLLRHVPNADEMRGGNWAVAFVEAGAYLALGIILNGAFAGRGGGALSGLQFFAIGQLTLIGTYLLYRIVNACSIEEEIRTNNLALAIEVGGFMLAVGIVQWFAIAGPFTGFIQDMNSYAEALVPGLLALALVMVLVDLVLLPRVTLRGNTHHGKIGPSLIIAGIVPFMGVIIGASLAAGLTG